MPTFSEDLAFRGLIHQVTDPGLLARLDAGSVTVYAGFDPSADSLHVGSLLQLCTLRRFQLAGHRPISLAGGGTGMIGDPGGKLDERVLLTREVLNGYLEGIRPQLGQFLDMSTAILLDNSVWLDAMTTLEFLRDVGKHFTINHMVAKESVKTRFERPDQGISYTEFSYMLLQAYDFLHLHREHGCDLQIGGSDQWGNITMGIELIRKVCGDEAWGLTTPLVVKADGTKFGKTETGTIWLDAKRTSPFAMYQFFFNAPDEVVGSYLRFFTFLSHEDIEALDEETAQHPERRSAQRALARSVVALVHGEREVAKCEDASAALFNEQIAALSEEMLLAVTEDAPTTDISLTDGLALIEALEQTGLAKSRGEAKRTIEQGGAYINNVQQRDVGRVIGVADLLHGTYIVVRKGKRDVHVLPRRMSKRIGALVLVLVVGVGLTGCAGEDQRGTPAHRMSEWVGGTGFGQDIGTLLADNARVPKDVPNGTGAVHAACGTLEDDAEMANDELPTPDEQVTNWLSTAYGLEGSAGVECYKAGSTDTKLLAEAARDTAKAKALIERALVRIQSIDNAVVSTTTTTDSGSGGIFG